MSSTHVVVVGGGYAGVAAADHLGKGEGISVTLINPRPEFVERIRLHQLACGSDDAVTDFAPLLGTHVTLVVDEATAIDATARTVRFASGRVLGYDYLVYAAGSISAETAVPGVAEYAHRVATLEEATQLRDALERLAGDAPTTVVGAGPTGIEMAAELAEQGRQVTLVCDQLGPYLHERVRNRVRRHLGRLRIDIVDGATVVEVMADAVRLQDGRELPGALTVWSAGFGATSLAASSGLTVDEIGRLRTDDTLTSVDDDRILAAGDCAAPPNYQRMSCQSALPLGMHAARTILARLDGVPPRPVSIGYAGQSISIGRKAGVIQLANRSDEPGRLAIGGRLGAIIKELVCRGTLLNLRREARRPGSIIAMPGPSRPRTERVAARI